MEYQENPNEWMRERIDRVTIEVFERTYEMLQEGIVTEMQYRQLGKEIGFVYDKLKSLNVIAGTIVDHHYRYSKLIGVMEYKTDLSETIDGQSSPPRMHYLQEVRYVILDFIEHTEKVISGLGSKGSKDPSEHSFNTISKENITGVEGWD